MDDNLLNHTGVLGMHWGKRSATTGDLAKLAKKNEALKTKLSTTEYKSEKNKIKVNKLTKKLTKRGHYITDIGYTLAENTGRKLSRKLNTGIKLDKKISKIESKIENNKVLMKSTLKDLPKDQINSGKKIVESAFK